MLYLVNNYKTKSIWELNMSRIGKLAISVPEKVAVSHKSDNMIQVKGNHGELIQSYPSDILDLKIADSQIIVEIKDVANKKARQFQGLYRTLINNMIIGVSEKFEKVLEINGVGYRAQVKGKNLNLNLGYSHPIDLEIPENIEIKVEGNVMTIAGICKQQVGLLAANIRDMRPPEPYKGKGIKYKNETIIRKVGKTGKK